MSSSTVASPTQLKPASTAQREMVSVSLAQRLAAYRELAKPRIAVMVLISMGVGYALASADTWQTLPLLHASLGVFFAVVASSALNQAFEARTDQLMERTRLRPIPAGKLTIREVLVFSFLCAVLSTLYLCLTVNVTTGLLTASTILLYAGIYTPLKRSSTLCTAVGAIPGAAPPLIGWAAAGGDLSAPAFSLFAILFVWQFPHFHAIAWMYKDQYLGAGLKMLPGEGRTGIIGPIAFGYALVLIPVSLLPRQFGLSGDFYAGVATTLGLMYAFAAWRFSRKETRVNARKLLFASLIYLPGVLIALVFDHFRLLHFLIHTN